MRIEWRLIWNNLRLWSKSSQVGKKNVLLSFCLKFILLKCIYLFPPIFICNLFPSLPTYPNLTLVFSPTQTLFSLLLSSRPSAPFFFFYFISILSPYTFSRYLCHSSLPLSLSLSLLLLSSTHASQYRLPSVRCTIGQPPPSRHRPPPPPHGPLLSCGKWGAPRAPHAYKT